MFSQFEEEKIILEYWGDRVASFLDIGAWDGIELSNTRALALKGWSGILVEPEPSAFLRLLNNVSSISGMICVNAAVSGNRELRRFHMQNEWGGTLNDERAFSEIRKRTGSYYTLTVSPDDLLSICEIEGIMPLFVSLDAEWMDDQILQSSANLLSGTELLCVEVTDDKFGHDDPIPRLCRELGFSKTIAKTRGNLIVSRG